MAKSLKMLGALCNCPPLATVLAKTMENREKGTISICFVEEALVGVRQRGLNAEALLARAGISPSLLASPRASVSPSHYGALWRLIAETLDDEFFGMDSHPMKSGCFVLLCQSVLHSDTLEIAIKRALRFLHMVLDDLHGSLSREGEVAHITLRERLEPQRMFAYATFLVMLHGIACWLVRRRIPILRAQFRCKEPAYSGECRVLFCTDSRFDRPLTRISIDASCLELPVVQNEASLKEFLRFAPANFLVKYRNSDSLTARIRRRLRQLPPGEWPDFETLATQLHTTPSTLRRRLREENQAYQSIKDDLRKDLAITYLSRSRQSVFDVALALGFAEPSAFHRAFKKWTGANPGEYRQSCD